MSGVPIRNRNQLTEVSDEMCINGIGSPFAVRYIAIVIDVETEFLETLDVISLTCISTWRMR